MNTFDVQYFAGSDTLEKAGYASRLANLKNLNRRMNETGIIELWIKLFKNNNMHHAHRVRYYMTIAYASQKQIKKAENLLFSLKI
ncbi:MAG: hypothetical protein IT281_01005 [Ignavibacteria bacterium]|nr:hypothetical protein [Ignavibacteria bacterium]MCC7158098.1 hypothetical protein [Ignavibacteria bacterium]